MSVHAYCLNSNEIIAEDFDEDIVLLNSTTGVYFRVAERARAFLSLVFDGFPPERLLADIKEQNETVAEEARGFFELLLANDILMPAQMTTKLAAEKAQIDQFLGSGDGFIFEGFDDLAELLLADPVHDIDELTGNLKTA